MLSCDIPHRTAIRSLIGKAWEHNFTELKKELAWGRYHLRWTYGTTRACVRWMAGESWPYIPLSLYSFRCLAAISVRIL
ncbi:hypothetical protein JB92DRAFT_1240703 [Gautieria morchelliformis]|nr:hypothetical protein JB92DRAFT_1240703 [Gautieria morchelliformis]